MSKPTENLIGRKFGRLTVIDFGIPEKRKDGRHNATFQCLCDCGNYVTVAACRLKNGNTSSCGCLHKEQIGKINYIHGESNKTRLYRIWCRMKQRCYNPNCNDYRYYGGKGVLICQEWINDYTAFMNWAVANGYDDSLTIDRINVDAGYCPDNCRWVSMLTQANNKSNNRVLEYNGESHTVTEWSRIVGISKKVLSNRVNRGWSTEDALTIKLGGQRRKITHQQKEGA